MQGGRGRPEPGRIEKRGNCGGSFSADLPGAEKRFAWCGFNAALIELPPVVPVEKILGVGIPDQVGKYFRSAPDERGFVDCLEVSRCPLVQVDTLSPRYDPGWLVEVFESVQAIGAKLPAGWHIQDPSPVLIDAVCMMRGEADLAGLWKSENNEEW